MPDDEPTTRERYDRLLRDGAVRACRPTTGKPATEEEASLIVAFADALAAQPSRAERLTLEQAAEHVGEFVLYHPVGQPVERGVITGVSSSYVFVRYGLAERGKATRASDLTLEGRSS